jgi:putative ABC transport system permease protein
VNNSLFVAWKQLSHQKMKLAAASAGVIVAVMLMLVQLGIRQGVVDNSVAFPKRIEADLVVVSPRTKTIFQSAQFARRLLYRLPSHPDVEGVSEIYMSTARWKNSWTKTEFPISIYGIEPTQSMIKLPGYKSKAEALRSMDRVVFDGMSRTTFGPVVQSLQEERHFETEVNQRRTHIIGAINVGVSINNDGNLFCTPTNFLRLFPNRSAGAIDLGLVQLKSGCNQGVVARQLQQLLGHEAKIVTRAQLIQSEIQFLRENAPIDFIFGMGAVVGFFIGFVVVYQILYTEVTNHLPQLATMKAMGFTDRYLLRLVVWQSLILSILGYVPGFFLAIALYSVAESQIQMPFAMTWTRGIGVLISTIVMCSLSAVIAIRKAWSADPAEVF